MSVLFEDLQLGDVVEVDTTDTSICTTIGIATVAGLDSQSGSTYNVMIAWKESDGGIISSKSCFDGLTVDGAIYLPDLQQLFDVSYWIRVAGVLRKISSTPTISSKSVKVYKDECPCGLTRNCDYHVIQ